MVGKIIDGRIIADQIKEEVKEYIKLKKLTPCLSIITVGNDPASEIYVKNKLKACEDTNINCNHYKFDSNVQEQEILDKIQELNENKKVSGILVQLPLPNHINKFHIMECINPNKDVDGFHSSNMGKLVANNKSGIIPCTPQGCVELIKSCLKINDLSGMNVVVIGRSEIVGKPVSIMLTNMNATVTLAHSKTKNLEELCKKSDIIVVSVGKPFFVKGDWIKSGAVVIDVGINRIIDESGKAKIVGDVDFNSAILNASFITPVPNGVGRMTIAMLLKNIVRCCEI